MLTSEEIQKQLEERRRKEAYINVYLYNYSLDEDGAPIGLDEVTINPKDLRYCGECFGRGLQIDFKKGVYYYAECLFQGLPIEMEDFSNSSTCLRNQICIEAEKQKYGTE